MLEAAEDLQQEGEGEEITPVQLAEATMTGDLMQLILDELKSLQEPWQKMPQHRQNDLLARIELRCREAAGKVIAIITADGKQVVKAILNKISIDKEIKAELLPRGTIEDLHMLTGAIKGQVYIAIPYDYEGNVGNEGKPKSEADQRSIFDSAEEEAEIDGEESEQESDEEQEEGSDE